MIGEYTLSQLCKKYNINFENLVNKNNNILTLGEYQEIDATLDYLTNTLHIAPSNIEKCPSILYRNVNSIKENVAFMQDRGIYFENIESCLHVLSTDPKQMKETYKYVCDNYGKDVLNRITSILATSVDVIQGVENLNIPFSNKEGNLSIAQAIEFGFQSLEEVKQIINSEVFKAHPELFTSTTLAHGNLKEIERIIESDAFKTHPELFTSETLARGSLEEIEKIIESDAFKTHPELFTSTTLARGDLEDILSLLAQPYWQDPRFSSLLSPTIVARSKRTQKKMPELIKIAEEHKIDHYLSSSFLLKSPSQVYALIRHLEDNNIPLVTDENNRLNPIFSCQPITMKKKYGVDLKELIRKYPYEKTNLEKEGGCK